jgi:hypothetical protein
MQEPDGAIEEAMAYAAASMAARKSRATMSVEQRRAMDAYSEEGFGIFAPGNPALHKVRAAVRGEKPPPEDAGEAAAAAAAATRSPLRHGKLDIPDKAVNEMLATLAKSGSPRDQQVLRDFQRANQPRWMRKLTPMVRVIGIVLAILVGVALLQGFVVHTFGPATLGGGHRQPSSAERAL